MRIFVLIALFGVSTHVAEAQILPTKLRVTVIDGLGNFVEGATVSIYESKEDYLASKNPFATLRTDKRGRVTFKEVLPKSYFVEASFEGMNNNGYGVKTYELSEGKINKVNTVIQ